uniref:DNA repair protein UVH3 n=1 Tax=Physcomitrium patens TaxID=3218 RepID=A0A7I4ABB3_PHYPA
MGVHGLWELLAPVGRRVSVESLGSRKLAIDASIWIIQFMKAMRDDRGDMIRNAHLLGFFRRICKLLFLRVKPVFVFDGGTPALKRRTVIARRRQREQAQSRIRKTAEKLLLNHLRTRKLEEIAGRGGTQNKSSMRNNIDNGNDVAAVDSGMNGTEGFPSSSGATSHSDVLKQEASDDLLVTSMIGHKKEDNEDTEIPEHEVQGLNGWDEVEKQDLDEDDEEELVYLPSTEGKLDPEVLASLPASVQLELLVQMREQLVAENRHKFQKVAKVPSSFSQLQIDAYLKTVAFRRGIQDAQKAAAVKGVGGVPVTRIASETNREFVFTTSYQGDKTALTGEGGGNSILTSLKPPQPKVQPPASTSSSLLCTNFTSLPINGGALSTDSDVIKNSDSTVQTYVDEKGRTRVSRVRGMGVLMTRDLQWNLYLMKDVEKRQALEELKDDNVSAFAESAVNSGDGEVFQKLIMGDNPSISESLSGRPPTSPGVLVQVDADQFIHDDVSAGVGPKVASNPDGMPHVPSIQITFNSNEDDEDEDLDLFKNLVRDGPQGSLEKPLVQSTASALVPVAEENDDDDCEWEDGDLQEMALAIQQSLAEHDRLRSAQPGVYPDSEDTGLSDDSDTGESGESEVEWEDGSGAVAVPAAGFTVAAGLGLTQEDIEVQEATRRSLNDVWRAPVRALPQLVIREPVEGGAKASPGGVSRVEEQESLATVDKGLNVDSEEARIARERARKGKAVAEDLIISSPAGVIRAAAEVRQQFQEIPSTDETQVSSVVAFNNNPRQDPSKYDDEKEEKSRLNNLANVNVGVAGFAIDDLVNREVGSDQNLKALLNGTKSNAEISVDVETDVPENPERIEKADILKEVESVHDAVNNCPKGSSPTPDQHDNLSSVVKPNFAKPGSESVLPMEEMLKDAEDMDLAKDREEMLMHEAGLLAEREALSRDEAELQAVFEKEQEELLAGIDKERELLLEEEAELRELQKKNERNADSVTSEMFAECQELLQMFGLPYVIAPMEAEAQCAFLDAEKLVDGVVTDDVDVFLFGGRNVYKNIFDDRKYVETYYMKDVETELGLDRDKLIRMALLLGSDYTEGVSGIGIVNAIEVVNAFDEDDGLKNFKEMVESVDLSLLELGGNGFKRKGSRSKAKDKKEKADDMGEDDATNEAAETSNGDDQDDAARELRQQAFMESHRAVSKNWKIPESFPSEAVVAEYKSPRVEKSKQGFSWGRPDLEALRKFCLERFSWPKEKADELLLSVLKEYDRQETQLRMDAFYAFNQRFAKVRSARIQKALRGTTGRLSKELVDVSSLDGPPAKKQKQRKGSSKKSVEKIATELVEEADLNSVQGNITEGLPDSEDLTSGHANRRGRGRRNRKNNKEAVKTRGRGRGRGSRGGRISDVTKADEDSASTASSESDHDDTVIEMKTKRGRPKRKAEDQLLPIRRSSRARKNEANYNEPAGSDDAADNPENEDDVSTGSQTSNPSREDHAEEIIDHRNFVQSSSAEYQAGAGAGHLRDDGDVHRDRETGAVAAETGSVPTPSYLFSGGGFCVPEEDVVPGLEGHHEQNDNIQPEQDVTEPCDPNELVSGQVDADITPDLSNVDQELIQTATQVAIEEMHTSASSGFRALPFLRRKRPSKQP